LISSQTEYKKAREELDHLSRWLSRLESENATVRKGLTVASIRKMISRLQDELAEYETAVASNLPVPEEQTNADDDVEHEA
jgi:predicted nuclease with TOPRIM domain